MDELIKRLERVIATGVPDKNGQHPISAEVVLDVVKQLQTAELGTNLAEVGTDCISRQAAIDAFNTNINELVVAGKENADSVLRYLNRVINEIKQLPPIQPEIVRCKGCKYAEYIDDVQTLWCTECGQGRTVAPNDFCSYAERREVTT